MQKSLAPLIIVTAIFLSACSSISIDESSKARILYRDRTETQNTTSCYRDKKAKTTTCQTIPVTVTTVLVEIAVAKSAARDDCYLILNGRIDEEFASAFEKGLSQLLEMKCERRIAVLSSSGGRVRDAMQIGTKIRANGIDTLFDGRKGRGNRCASSCTLIFIAGRNRIVTENPVGFFSGNMGFHQWSRGVGIEKACTNPDAIRRSLAPYAHRMLPAVVAEQFIDMTIKTECHKTENYSPEELIKLGIANQMDIH